MLDEALSINPTSLKIGTQLQQVGDFYVCSYFTEEFVGPSTLVIEGAVYYRFMKFIYIPQPPEKLHTEQVIELCNLRLDYLHKIVDLKFNDYIVGVMANCLALSHTHSIIRMKVLDFGCGSGLSSQLMLKYVPNLDIVGIDISEKAVRYSTKQGLTAIHTFPGELLPFRTESFDRIFAAFVMHFSIDLGTLKGLRRVLRASGKFAFNTYQRNIDKVVQSLQEAGFRSIELFNNIPGNYVIVSCKAL